MNPWRVAILFLVIALCAQAYAATCGNSSCESGENACNCPADCGKCSGEVVDRPCREYGCVNKICRVITVPNCCPNAMCESGENYGNCPGDCTPKEVKAELLEPAAGAKFMRGDKIPVKMRATADGRAIASADTNISGFFGIVRLLNDGKHNDELLSDNIYGAFVRIGPDAPGGMQELRVDLNFIGIKNHSEVQVEIDPKLEHGIVLPTSFTLGGILEVSGTVTRRGEPLSIPLDFNVFMGSTKIFAVRTMSDETGKFSVSYHSTMLDPLGKWHAVVYGEDNYGNYAKAEGDIEVSLPKLVYPLSVEQIGSFDGRFERGTNLQFVIRIKDEYGGAVAGVSAEVLAPLGERIKLLELQPGQYTAAHTIPYSLPVGTQSYRVMATLEEASKVYRGSKDISLLVGETSLVITVVEPKKRYFRIGEAARIELEITYPNSDLVGEADVKGLIMGKAVNFTPLAAGVFEATYVFEESDAGDIKLFFRAEDSFGNIGLADRSVEVAGQTILYVLQRNIVPLAIALAIVGVAGTFFGRIYYRKLKRARFMRRQQELMELEKEIQHAYFEEGTLTKSEYKDSMDRYEAELKRIEQELSKPAKG